MLSRRAFLPPPPTTAAAATRSIRRGASSRHTVPLCAASASASSVDPPLGPAAAAAAAAAAGGGGSVAGGSSGGSAQQPAQRPPRVADALRPSADERFADAFAARAAQRAAAQRQRARTGNNRSGEAATAQDALRMQGTAGSSSAGNNANRSSSGVASSSSSSSSSSAPAASGNAPAAVDKMVSAAVTSATTTTTNMSASSPSTATPVEVEEGELQATWARKGYANAVSRTLEIWSFFFTCVSGESKIRKLTNPVEASQRRTAHAKAMKNSLLSLGPTFIKLGQLMSTRVDIVPKEYIDEFSSLQDRVPGFSGTRAIEVIEAEFGRPIAELYEFFDPNPIAAASLGQVHRAVMNGQQVAVKIQRSGLKELFDVDLKNLKLLARLLDKLDPKNDGANRNWVSIYEESAKLLYEEIDYVLEAQNADRFRANFADTSWIKVPDIYWDRTSTRVLTMEYVPGIKINDYDAIEKAGIDRRVLARRSAESYLTQLLRHGYFHTDPHCGNISCDAEEGGRLIVYDYGMMSSFPANIKEGLVNVIFGIYEGSATDICDAMVSMGVLSRGADRITVEKVGRYFLGLFRTNLQNENKKKSKEEKRAEMIKRLDSIGEDLLAVSEDECFNFPPVFTFVFRSFTTLEGIGKGLDPNYDLTLIAGPYLKDLIDLRDGSAAVTAVKSLRKKLGWRNEDIKAVVTAPRKTAYIESTLRRMESGDLRLRVRVLESERAFKRMSLMQENMAFALAAATFSNIACVLMAHTERYAIQAKLTWLIACMFAIRLAIGLMKYRSLEQRLQKYTKGGL